MMIIHRIFNIRQISDGKQLSDEWRISDGYIYRPVIRFCPQQTKGEKTKIRRLDNRKKRFLIRVKTRFVLQFTKLAFNFEIGYLWTEFWFRSHTFTWMFEKNKKIYLLSTFFFV